MVYEILLTQEGGMSIPSDVLKRVKARRPGLSPAYCGGCTAVFSNIDDLSRHHCSVKGYVSKQYDWGIPNLPAVCTPILRVCRLIHLEAVHILYTKNAFYFSNPATAHAFLWRSDRIEAVHIQEIIIRLADPHILDLWCRYVTQSKAGLAQDFPHLRRMTIHVKRKFELASSTEKRFIFQSIAENVRGLDWVHIDRLNNEDLLEYLKPMVSRHDDSQVLQRQVQSHVRDCTANDCWGPWSRLAPFRIWSGPSSVVWKSATLWWGTSESRGPYDECRPSEPHDAGSDLGSSRYRCSYLFP